MTTDTRSPREIEEKRADLTSNIEDLQDKFSIDTLVRQVGDQFREHGGDMGRSISEQVKANPIPLALTGIGIAWMMFGNTQRSTGGVRDAIDYSDTPKAAFRRSRNARGLPYTSPTTSYAGAQATAEPACARYDDDKSNDRASISNKASAAVSGTADRMSDAKDKVGDHAKTAQAGIAAARARLAQGTEDLSEDAGKRVIAAREKALDMRDQAARSLSSGADTATDMFERQPLVAGAIALALGAAMGGAIPRTQTEDDLITDPNEIR